MICAKCLCASGLNQQASSIANGLSNVSKNPATLSFNEAFEIRSPLSSGLVRRDSYFPKDNQETLACVHYYDPLRGLPA